MIAFVTSTGEPTTELCRWALERNGFEVIIVQNKKTLWDKLKLIYSLIDEDFVRVDADVIVNNKLTAYNISSKLENGVWWYQYLTFDWYKQDTTHGGVQFIRKKALQDLRNNIDKFVTSERPESQMYRLDEFENPRRGKTIPEIMGIHGYGIQDIASVMQTKERRNQMGNYDFKLVERLNAL